MCLIYLTYYAPYIISISYQDVTQYGSTTASTSRAYVWCATYKRQCMTYRAQSVKSIISGAHIVSTTAGTSRVPVSNTTYKPQPIICCTDSVYMSLI